MQSVGYAAMVLTIATFLPQAFKVIKTRKTRDLALSTYILLVIVSALWTVYGVSIHSFQIVTTNSVVGFIAFFICFLKLKHG